MPPDVASHVEILAANGAPLVFLGAVPSAQPGLHDADAGDAAVQQAMRHVLAGARVMRVDLGNEVEDALITLGVEGTLRHRVVPQPFRMIRRDLARGGHVVFVRNPSPAARSLRTGPDGPCAQAFWADPWTGAVAAPPRDAEGRFEIPLAAYGSGFLFCDVPGPPPELAETLAARALPTVLVRTQPIDGWSLAVDDPSWSALPGASVLGDWREMGVLADAFGPGVYQASVTVPRVVAGERLFLDLGRVEGVARVAVGDRFLGAAQVPPYRVEVPADLAGATIDVVVVLTPPARNGLLAAAAAGDATVSQFKGKQDTRIAAGLLGPVVLEVRR